MITVISNTLRLAWRPQNAPISLQNAGTWALFRGGAYKVPHLTANKFDLKL